MLESRQWENDHIRTVDHDFPENRIMMSAETKKIDPE